MTTKCNIYIDDFFILSWDSDGYPEVILPWIENILKDAEDIPREKRKFFLIGKMIFEEHQDLDPVTFPDYEYFINSKNLKVVTKKVNV